MLRFSWRQLRLAALFLLACALWAQGNFATITGLVTDSSGGVVPEAKVAITHLETGYLYETKTNEAGQYTVANLRSGTFRVRISAPGFQEFAAEQVQLTGRDTRRIDASLDVGSVDTIVQVEGGAALIETERAVISDVKDREVLRALPLTLRRAWDYFTMTPQVERTSSWHISIGGSWNNQSIAAIDGTPINAADGGTGIGPLMDRTESLSELRIDMAQGSAEQATAGQVSLISRAGTNEFHGAVSDYYSTTAFRARDPFQSSVTPGVTHLFTGSAGGPIYIPKIYDGRNKSFFFFTYEGNFGSARTNSFNNGVPLEAWRRGDFSNANVQLRDPFNNNAPFPNNQIPANRISPVAKAIQERFYPLPNFGDPSSFTNNNYREIRTTATQINPQITTRLDHRFTDKDFVYGRWTAVRWDLAAYDTAVPTVQELRPRRRDMDAITLAYTRTFSASIMNEFRYGYTRQDFPVEAVVNGRDLVSDLGLKGLAADLPDIGGIHRVDFQGLGITRLEVSNACSPCGRHRIHNFTNNLSWYRGNHALKFGYFGNYAMNGDQAQDSSLFGWTSYSNRFSGFPYADFLLGVPTTMRRAFPAVERDNRRLSHAVYVNDEWKIRPTLTLTLGLRWDIHNPWTEVNDRMAIFDIDTGQVVVPDAGLDKVSPLLPAGFVDVVGASSVGRPEALVKTDWNNLAPRFGLAWRPFGPNTVFRASYGLYYDTAPWQPSSAGAPFVLSEPAFTNPQNNPLVLPTVFPEAGVGGPSSFNLPNGIRPDLRIPYSQSYTATIEHQRWDTGFRVSYTGMGSRQGIYRYDINQPVVDSRLYVEKPRLFPKYPNILYTDNGAGHQYHAVTGQVERRMKSGVHFQLYYTLARDIGDLERGQQPEDAYNRHRERAAWERLPSQRFSGNFIYQLPFGKGRFWGNVWHPVADAVLGGWEVSGIVALESGRFITPLWTGPDPTGTFFTTNATRPVVTIRPDHLYDANLENPSIDMWFDPNAFAAPPVGRFGTAAKGVIRGAPTEVFHASVAKHFYFKERARLRLEMLATNAFNHPNYRDPNTNISQAGAVGRVTEVINRNLKFDSAIPRALQAQIRLEW